MARFKDAVNWIVENDIDWDGDDNGIPSVSVCLVADVFNFPIDVVVLEIRKAVKKQAEKNLVRHEVRHNKRTYFVIYDEVGDQLVAIETEQGKRLKLNNPLARDIISDQIVFGLDGNRENCYTDPIIRRRYLISQLRRRQRSAQKDEKDD